MTGTDNRHSCTAIAMIMIVLTVAINLVSVASSGVILVGSASPNGLLLSQWSLETNTSTAFGSPVSGLIPPPNNAAAAVLSDPAWGIAALTSDDLSAVLVNLPLDGTSITTENMSGGEDARCFIVYASLSEGNNTLRCFSEVDSGTLSTTELRSVDRRTGKTTVITSGLMPCFSPLGPAVYDDKLDVVIALYFYSPCHSGVLIAQGNYLVTLNSSTGAELSRVPVSDENRVIQLVYDADHEALLALAESSAAVLVGTLDPKSAAFTPLPASPNFATRFAYFPTDSAAMLSSGSSGVFFFTASIESVSGGPPVLTPWLVAVNATTGVLIYESPSDGPTTFSLLAWADV